MRMYLNITKVMTSRSDEVVSEFLLRSLGTAQIKELEKS